MKKSISLFSQLHKKAIFYGIVGESGWFPQMLASRKTTAENTKLTETVSICVNLCLNKIRVNPCNPWLKYELFYAKQTQFSQK